jgi:hypothetical protein
MSSCLSSFSLPVAIHMRTKGPRGQLRQTSLHLNGCFGLPPPGERPSRLRRSSGTDPVPAITRYVLASVQREFARQDANERREGATDVGRRAYNNDFLIERRSSVIGEERPCAFNCTKDFDRLASHRLARHRLDREQILDSVVSRKIRGRCSSRLSGEQFELPGGDLVHGSVIRVFWSRGDVPTLECDDLTPAPAPILETLPFTEKQAKSFSIVVRVNGKNILVTASGRNAR